MKPGTEDKVRGNTRRQRGKAVNGLHLSGTPAVPGLPVRRSPQGEGGKPGATDTRKPPTLRLSLRHSGLPHLLTALLLLVGPSLVHAGAATVFRERNGGWPPPEYVSVSSTDNLLGSFKIANTTTTGVNLTGLTVSQVGTLPAAGFANVRLYAKSTRPIVGTDTPLANIPAPGTTNFAFTGFAQATTTQGYVRLWVFADITNTPTPGDTIQLQIQNAGAATWSAAPTDSTPVNPVLAGINAGPFANWTTTVLGAGCHIVYEKENPPDVPLVPGETRVRLGTFRTYADSGSGTISTLRFTNVGTLSADSNITSVRLYSDDNAGPEDGATFLGQAPFSGNTVTFSGLSESITTTPKYLHVEADISATATVGQTFILEIAALGDVTLSAGTNAVLAPSTTTCRTSAVATFKTVKQGGGADYATITAAVAAIPGAMSSPWVIEVQDSATYSETVTISGKTTSTVNRIWLRAGIGRKPVISANPTTANNTLLISGVSWVRVSGFEVTGSTGAAGFAAIVGVVTASNECVLERLRTHNGVIGFGIQSCNDWTVRNCVFDKLFVGANAYPLGAIDTSSRGRYYGNTWVHDGEGTALPFTPSGWMGLLVTASSDVTIRNSFFRNRPPALGAATTCWSILLNDSASSDGFSTDFNYHYYQTNASGTGAPGKWSRPATPLSATTMTNWLRYSGDEEYSWGSDTGGALDTFSSFVDPATGDFHLRSKSGHWASIGYSAADATDGEGTISKQTSGTATNDFRATTPLHAGDYFRAPFNYYFRQQPSNGVASLSAGAQGPEIGAYGNTPEAALANGGYGGTKVWTGGSGANWDLPASWSPAGPPGATDTVCIPSVSTPPTVSGATAPSIRALAINGGTLTLSMAGSFTLSTPFEYHLYLPGGTTRMLVGNTTVISGVLRQTAGSMSTMGDLRTLPATPGALDLTGGSFTFGSSLLQQIILGATESFNNLSLLAGSNPLDALSSFNVKGNLTVGRTLAMSTGTTLGLTGGAAQAFTIDTVVDIPNLTVNQSPPSTVTVGGTSGDLTVTGLMTATSGTFIPATPNSFADVTCNGGTIRLPAGNMTVTGVVTLTSGTLLSDGGTIDLMGPSTLLLNGGTLENRTGTTTVNSGTMTLTSGTFLCGSGTLTLLPAVDLGGASIVGTGGTLALNSGLTVTSGALNVSGCTVSFANGLGLTIGAGGTLITGGGTEPIFTRGGVTNYPVVVKGTANVNGLRLQYLSGTGLQIGTNGGLGDGDTVAATVTALDDVSIENCAVGVLIRNISNSTSSGSPLTLRGWAIDASIQTSGYAARIDGSSPHWITFENATGASGQRLSPGSAGEQWDVDPYDSDFPTFPGSQNPGSEGQIRWAYFKWKWLGQVNSNWSNTTGSPSANWERDGVPAISNPFYPDGAAEDVYIASAPNTCTQDAMRTVRDITIGSGTFILGATYTLVVNGDFLKPGSATFSPGGASAVRFEGSAEQRLTVIGGGPFSTNVLVLKSGGTLSLGASITLSGAFDVSTGTLDIAAYTLTCDSVGISSGNTILLTTLGGALRARSGSSGSLSIDGTLTMGSDAFVDWSAGTGNVAVGGTGVLTMSGTTSLTGGTGTTTLGGTVSMTGATSILIPNAASLSITGSFSTSGTAAPWPTITRGGTTGRMSACNVVTGATLNIAGLNVSYAPSAGMAIQSGVTITRFDRVAFTNAAAAGNHLAISGIYTRTSVGCSFDASFTTGKNVDATGMTGGMWTFGSWAGSGGGEAFDNDPLEPGGNRVLFSRTLTWVGRWRRYRTIPVGAAAANAYVFVHANASTTPTGATLNAEGLGTSESDELRVACRSTGTSTWQELARTIVANSASDKAFHFRLPSDFNSGTGEVRMYYDYQGTSPAAPALVDAESPKTIYSDGFESGDLTAGGWTITAGTPVVNPTEAAAGTFSALVNGTTATGTHTFRRVISTATYYAINTAFYRKLSNVLDPGGATSDTLTSSYTVNNFTGTVNIEVLSQALGTTFVWAQRTDPMPATANNNAGFGLQFSCNVDSTSDIARVDEVRVTGYRGDRALNSGAVLSDPASDTTLSGVGTDGLWSDPFHWTDGASPRGLGPPTANDDAAINGNGSYVPIIGVVSGSCLSLSLGQTTASNLNFAGSFLLAAGAGGISILGSGTLNAANSGGIGCAGDWTNNGTFTPSTSTLTMNGTGPQNMNGGTSAKRTVYHLTINNTGGAGDNTVTALGGFDINGDFTLSVGKFDPGTFTHTVAGNWDDSGGTFTPTAGTIVLDGGAARTLKTSAANNFWNLTVTGSTSITFSPGSDLMLDVDGELVVSFFATLDMWDGTNPAALDVEGDLSLGTGGTLNPRTSTAHDVAGNWDDFDGSFTPTAGTITLSASGNSTIRVSSFNNFFNLLVSNPGTTSFYSGTDLTLDVNGFLGVDAGTLDMTDGTSNVALDVAGDLYITSGGTLNPRGSTAHNVAGNWDDSGGTFTPTAGTVTLSDADGSTIKSAAANNFFDLVIANAGTTLFDPATDPVLDVNGSLTVNAGTLDMKAGGTDVALDVEGNLTLSGGGTLDPRGSTAHDVAGNWDDSAGTFLPTAGRITLSDADGSTINVAGLNNFWDLTISNAGTTSFAAATSPTLDVDGNLLVSGGTLDMFTALSADVELDVEGNLTLSGGATILPRSATTHDVAGNWDDSGGTFQAGAGKITLSAAGAGTIKVGASNYFNDLTIDNTGTTSMDAATPDGIDVRGNFTVQGGTFEFGDDSHAIGDAAADLFLISSLGIVEMGSSTVTCLADIDVIGTGVPELRFTAGAATLKMGPSQLLRVGNGAAAWDGKLVCSGAGTVATITTSGTVGVNLWGLTVTNFSTLSVNKAGTAGDRLRIVSHSPGGVQINSGAILDNGTAGEAKGIAFESMVNSGTDDTYLVFGSTGAENFRLRNCSFDGAACDHNVSVAVAFTGTVRMYGTTGTKGTEAFEDDPVGTGVTTPGRILWPTSFPGTVYLADETTLASDGTMQVSFAVNGGAADDTQAINPVDGTFTVQGFASAGDMLAFYLDGHASDGVTVTEYGGAALGSLKVMVDRLVVRNDNASSTTNVKIDTAHNGDADMTALYTDGGGASLSVTAGKRLHLPSGVYQPDMAVAATTSTPFVKIAGGVLDLSAEDHTISVTDTASDAFQMTSGALVIDSAGDSVTVSGGVVFSGGTTTMSDGWIYCSGDWDDNDGNGSFVPTGGTVRFLPPGSKTLRQRSTATANVFYDLDIDIGGGNTATAITPLTVNHRFQMMGGVFDTGAFTHTIGNELSIGGGTFRFSTSGEAVVNVTGTADGGPTSAFSLAGGTLQMDSPGDILDVAGGVYIGSGAEAVTGGEIRVAKSWDDSAGSGSWSPTGGVVKFDGSAGSSWASNMVISEVRISGDGGDPPNDEFIELYNPTGVVVNLVGLKLSLYNSTGTWLWDIVSGLNVSNVPAYGYVLLAATSYNDGAPGANYTYGNGLAISNDQSLRLYLNGTTLVDGVGWGSAVGGGVEGTAVANPAGNGSIERKPGGAGTGNGVDTNDNAADFDAVASGLSGPQSTSSTEQPASAVQTITRRTAAVANSFFNVEVAVHNGSQVKPGTNANASGSLQILGDLTLTSGTFNTGTFTHQIGTGPGGRLILNGGTFQFTTSGSATVNVVGTGDAGASAALTLAGGTLAMDSAGDILTVSGGVTISGGNENIQLGRIDCALNWDDSTTSNGFTPTGGIVRFTGNGSIKQRSAATRNLFQDFEITGGNRTIAAPDANADGSLDINGRVTITAGTFDPGAYTHTVAGNWDDSGASGGFLPTAGTIKFDGTGTIKQRTLATANRFFNLTISAGTRSIAATDANSNGSVDIDGSVTINGTGTLNPGAYTHTVAGNWTSTTGTFSPASGIIRFDGAGAQTITSAVTRNFWAVQIANTSAVDAVTLSGTVAVTDTVSGLTVGDGTLEVGSATLLALGGVAVQGTGNPVLSMTGTGTISLGNGEAIVIGDAVNPAQFTCSGAGTVATINVWGGAGNYGSFLVRAGATLNVNKAGTAGEKLILDALDNAVGLRLENGALVNNGSAGTLRGIEFTGQQAGGTAIDFQSTGAQTYWVKDCAFGAPNTAGTDFCVKRAAGFTGTIRMLNPAGVRGTEVYEADPLVQVAGPAILWSSSAIAGTVRGTDEATPVTGDPMNVSLLVGGALLDTQPVNVADGTFSVSSVFNTGDILTLFIDGHGSNRAVTVTETSGGALAGLNVILDRLVVRNDNAGITTSTELDTGNNGDADLTAIYGDGGLSWLTVAAGKRLYLESGTYQPDTAATTTTTPSLRIAGGTLSLAGGEQTVNVNGGGAGAFSMTSGALLFDSAGDLLDVNGSITLSGGTMTMTAGTIDCGGNWDDTAASSCFNPTGGTIRMDGGAAENVSQRGGGTANSFYDFVVVNPSVVTALTSLHVTHDFSIEPGIAVAFETGAFTHTIDNRLVIGGGAFRFSTTGDSVVNVNGTGDAAAGVAALEITDMTLQMDSAGDTMNVAGGVYISGGPENVTAGVINVAKSWDDSNASGSWTPSGGTVRFNGSVAPDWASNLVISEVQTEGTTLDDEFVEIYNPTGAAISLPANWGLDFYDDTGTLVGSFTSLVAETVYPYSYYLIASLGFDDPGGFDNSYSGDYVLANGSVRLRGGAVGPVLDGVGWGTATGGGLEGTAIGAPGVDGSVSRLPGSASAGNGKDTNSNSADFQVNGVSFPQTVVSAPQQPATATQWIYRRTTATANSFYNVEIAAQAGMVVKPGTNANATGDLLIFEDMTVTSGTFDTGWATHQIGTGPGGRLILNGGTFQFVRTNEATVSVVGTGNAGPAAALTIAGGALAMDSANDVLQVSGGVSITAGGENITGGRIDCALNWDDSTASGVFTPTGGAVRFTGNGSIKQRSAATRNSFWGLQNQGGTRTIAATDANSDGSLDINGSVTFSGGVFDPGAYTHTVAGNWDDSTAGGGFAPTAGTINFDGNGTIKHRSLATRNNFFNLTVSAGTRSIAATDANSDGTLDINGDVTISGGTFSPGAYSHCVAGDWNDTGGGFAQPAFGEIIFDGSSAQSVTSSFGRSFDNLTVTNSGAGPVTLSGLITVTNFATVTDGTLEIGNATMQVSAGVVVAGAGAPELSMTGAGTIQIDAYSSMDIGDGTAPNAGKFTCSGAGTVSTITTTGVPGTDPWYFGITANSTLSVNKAGTAGDTLRLESLGQTGVSYNGLTLAVGAIVNNGTAGEIRGITFGIQPSGDTALWFKSTGAENYTVKNCVFEATALPGPGFNVRRTAAYTGIIAMRSISGARGTAAYEADSAGQTTPGQIRWGFLLSGIVRQVDEATPLTGFPPTSVKVSLLLNGVAADGPVDVNDTNGAFSLNATTGVAGDLATVFIDNHGTYKAVLVTEAGGADLTGLNLIQSRLVVRNDNGDVTTNTELDTANNGDADITAIYTNGTGTTLTLPWARLYLESGTYQPGTAGGAVTNAGWMKIAGGTLSFAGGNQTVNLTPNGLEMTSGSFGLDSAGDLFNIDGSVWITGGSTTTSAGVITCGGDWDDSAAAGGFAPTGGTVEFSGSPGPVWATYVVISEVQLDGDGLNPPNDEFVELYNPTSSSIDLTGWKIELCDTGGTPLGNLVAAFPPISIAPFSYVLVAPVDYNGGPVDVPYDESVYLGADNSIILTNASPGYVDGVGWGTASSGGVELSPASSPAAGGSIERRPGSGGTGNGDDSLDNSADFQTVGGPGPQDSSGPSEQPSGAVQTILQRTSAGTNRFWNLNVNCGTNEILVIPAANGNANGNLAIENDLKTMWGIFDTGAGFTHTISQRLIISGGRFRFSSVGDATVNVDAVGDASDAFPAVSLDVGAGLLADSAGDILAVRNGGVLFLSGSWSVVTGGEVRVKKGWDDKDAAGAWTPTGGKVVFDDTAAGVRGSILQRSVAIRNLFWDLEIAADAGYYQISKSGANTTYSNTAPFLIQGDLLVTGGKLNLQTVGADQPYITVGGNVNVSTGAILNSLTDNNKMRVAGDWTCDGTFTSSGLVVAFNGSAQSISSSTGSNNFARIEVGVDETNTTVTLQNNVTLGSSANITEGMLALNGKTMTIAGANWVRVWSGGKLRMNAGSVLEHGTGTLIADSGSTVETFGTGPAAMATFTSNSTATTWGASLDGTVNLKYYRVLRTNVNGFGLNGGSTVTSLDYGEFDYPAATGTCLRVFGGAGISVFGCRFENSAGATGVSNVRSTAGTDRTVTMYGWGGALGGEDYDDDAFNRITWTQDVFTRITGGGEANFGTLQAALNAATTANDIVEFRGAGVVDLGGGTATFPNVSGVILRNAFLANGSIQGSAGGAGNRGILRNCFVTFTNGAQNIGGVAQLDFVQNCTVADETGTAGVKITAAAVENTILSGAGGTITTGSPFTNLTGVPASLAVDPTRRDYHLEPGATSTLTAGITPVSVNIPVANTASFNAGGGTVYIEGDDITYTGKSVASGAGNLTGASGISGNHSTAGTLVTENPAIDAGTNLNAAHGGHGAHGFADDIDGNPRPSGTAWDIGADEFGATILSGANPAAAPRWNSAEAAGGRFGRLIAPGDFDFWTGIYFVGTGDGGAMYNNSLVGLNATTGAVVRSIDLAAALDLVDDGSLNGSIVNANVVVTPSMFRTPSTEAAGPPNADVIVVVVDTDNPVDGVGDRVAVVRDTGVASLALLGSFSTTGVLDSADGADALYEPIGIPTWDFVGGSAQIYIPASTSAVGGPVRMCKYGMDGVRDWSNATHACDYRAPGFYGSGLTFVYGSLTGDTGDWDVAGFNGATGATMTQQSLGIATVNRQPVNYISPNSSTSWVLAAPEGPNAYGLAGATAALQWTSGNLGGTPTTQCLNPSSYTWMYLGVGEHIAKVRRDTGAAPGDAADWPTTDWLKGRITTNLLSWAGWMYFGTERGYCYRIAATNDVTAGNDGTAGVVSGFPYRVPGARVMGVSFDPFGSRCAFFACEDGRIVAFRTP